jgi:hypothetical protein
MLPFGETKDFFCEDGYDALRLINELRQRWNDRLSIENLALAKRYLETEFEVGVVIDVRALGAVVGQEFVAVFKRELSINRGASQFWSRRITLGADLNDPMFECEGFLGAGDRDQKQVLIRNVNVVQANERVVSSLVWLEPAYQFYRACAGALNPENAAGSKIGSVRTYWERSVLCGLPAVLLDESDCKMVKSGSEIVNAVADDGSPVTGDGFAFAKAVDFVTKMRIRLHGDEMGLSSFESSDCVVQVTKMFFGPINLYSDAA